MKFESSKCVCVCVCVDAASSEGLFKMAEAESNISVNAGFRVSVRAPMSARHQAICTGARQAAHTHTHTLVHARLHTHTDTHICNNSQPRALKLRN